jgi:hypothetical protein
MVATPTANHHTHSAPIAAIPACCAIALKISVPTGAAASTPPTML